MLMRNRKSLVSDRRGMAAVEFALIAPALIFLTMGVLEMAFRFRAKEEATRYVHQAADLVAREDSWTTAGLKVVYDSAVYMMKPVETTSVLDLDIASIGWQNTAAKTPYVMWRRVSAASTNQVPLTLATTAGMGAVGETVVRVAVRYRYTSPISSLFGGNTMSIISEAYARPRESRVIKVDGVSDNNGVISTF